MFRPNVDACGAEPRVISSRRGRAALVAAVAAGLALTPGAPAGASSAVAAGTGDVAISQVVLSRDGEVLTQLAPAEGVRDHGAVPIDVLSVTVDHGGPVTLVPSHAVASVVNVGFPPSLTGVAASENGVLTAGTDPAFAAAGGRIFSSVDLRDYVRSDFLNQPGTSWGADYDVVFEGGLSGDQYLLVSERDGNAPFSLQPLDAAGAPLAGAGPVVFEAPYRWNTGYAPSDQDPAQPVHLSVIDVASLLPGGTGTVNGLRVDNDGEADIKLTALVTAGAPEPAIEQVEGPAAAANAPVVFTKSVYTGHDDGAGCASAASYAEVPQGAAATYCFTVTNTGASHLDAITITDALVAGDVVLASADSVPLAPGHSARYHLQTAVPADAADGAVDGTFVNTASMAAVAVTPDGTPVDGAAGITATAEATVYPPLELPTASIELGTSVYAGHDGGVGCPAADVTVVSEGDNITYCFMITNTGNTYLDSITIADPYLTGSPQLIRTDSMPLAPGDSALYHLDATAPGLPPDGFLYTSDVTANAVDEAGADLTGVTEAAATDDTRVAAGAPLQLAFTGWETWLVAAAGLALSAGGWALLRSSDRRDPLSDRPSDRSLLAAAEPR